jgi:hypothetical protein
MGLGWLALPALPSVFVDGLPIRSLPGWVFLVSAALCAVVEFLSREADAYGISALVFLRYGASALLSMHPHVKVRSQRLPGAVAAVSAVLFYGGVLSGLLRDGSRPLADSLDYVMGALGAGFGYLSSLTGGAAPDLALPVVLQDAAFVDSILRALGWAGVAAAAWSCLPPPFFPGALVGADGGTVETAAAPAPKEVEREGGRRRPGGGRK